MNRRIGIILATILLIVGVLYIYFLSGVTQITCLIQNQPARMILTNLVRFIPVILLAGVFLIIMMSHSRRHPGWYSLLFECIGIFMLFLIPALVFNIFLIIQDILVFFSHTFNALIHQDKEISSRFFLLPVLGMVFYCSVFLIILYGITIGRFNFQVRRFSLEFKDLPPEFNLFKIVHFSDLHAGSLYFFRNKIKKAVDIIKSINPDIILFTGDMVNDLAEELRDWKDVLNPLEAPYGKLSILGNHDYGEYFPWKNDEEKLENVKKVIEKETEMGFKVMLNEGIYLTRGEDRIGIAGVENWGLPPFKAYGKLDKALAQIAEASFKILLSHDPSHWDGEILNSTNINLTLSGHTHGFQFGIRSKWLNWSPVKLKYPRWGGLYKEGKRYLYVSTGIGYIGFPGRIGIPPEITVIELINPCLG